MVPELCRFVKNLKEIQSECKDKAVFAEISKAIKITAGERKEYEEKFIEFMNKNEKTQTENGGVCRIREQCDEAKGICFDKINVKFKKEVSIVNGIFDERRQEPLEEVAVLKGD